MSDLHAPAVLYLCHSCQDHSPESCGYPASDVRRMPGGTQLCEPCFENGDDEGRWRDLSAVTSVEALAAENAALRERIARAQSCFWPEDDGETCYSDASDIYQEVDAGKVVGISCGGVIWTRYFAWLEPAVDCFDSDDDFVVDADTMEEAARLVRAELDRRASLPPEMDP
jgi:hypothetical protein